jgi:hypothetical protein
MRALRTARYKKSAAKGAVLPTISKLRYQTMA